jgi:hypothetical protein
MLDTTICTAGGLIAARDLGEMPGRANDGGECPCCVLGCLTGCGSSLVADIPVHVRIAFSDAEKSSLRPDDHDGPAARIWPGGISQRGPPPVHA